MSRKMKDDSEAEQRELLKDNPDLIPVDEFEMSGSLMVVGRETTLPSRSVDLVAIARGGELLLVEFKTGPQNSDFRGVLAQLMDYGSHLWERTYDRFEREVALRFFEADRCKGKRVKGKRSLDEAARGGWADMTDEELLSFKDQVSKQLASGSFHYVVAAQRFRPAMERTVQYLNKVAPGPRFYAVELVRFSADGISAFGSRTVHRPTKFEPTHRTNQMISYGRSRTTNIAGFSTTFSATRRGSGSVCTGAQTECLSACQLRKANSQA